MNIRRLVAPILIRRASPTKWAGRLFAAGAFLCATQTCAAVDFSAPGKAGGSWDLAQEHSHRNCQVLLKEELTPGGGFIGMPAGCRRAMPILFSVEAWRARGENRLSLVDAAGQEVLDFTLDGARMTAKGPGGEIYRLNSLHIPGSTSAAGAVDTTLPTGSTAAAKAPVALESGRAGALANAPKHSGDVAGHYSVLRGEGRKTGCMLTLENETRGSALRAVLAPACRDQGLIIFDPVSWALERGQIILTARKGHVAHLDFQADGTWAKDPKDGNPLILKRM